MGAVSDTVSHLVTLGCGVLLGVVITLVVIMVRDIWYDGKKGNDNGDY